ncbi:hypothetical protein BST65_02485 [Bradyrhizobium canariense]|nr:hypothetical protein BST65_02485 [Bradyrhizobium canariense]OSI36907.1 hypothetical protein BST66_05180 [Bradyrhizobium canariense]OSI50935.1 hypothetical protein BSZ20_05260 [Bradyrhizobium canariense]OSI57421.1 hypothetical protein BST67_01930 [Bradyrhizobium canariense]OSI60572.1 hypothetical protein BSZ15_01620 [Bradyrhizobium canariense]
MTHIHATARNAQETTLTQNTPSIVEIRNLRKEFGNAVAVDDLTLSVRTGEVLCLLGPSGCGKTTTLRMIAGFMEPEAGWILINGREATGLPPIAATPAWSFKATRYFRI